MEKEILRSETTNAIKAKVTFQTSYSVATKLFL